MRNSSFERSSSVEPRGKSKKRYGGKGKVKGIGEKVDKQVKSYVREMKAVKAILDDLPGKKQYKMEMEVDYLRQMATLISLILTLRLQQIPYVVTAASVSKIMLQFLKQTQHKQIILCLLKLLAKGFEEYQSIWEEMILNVDFMIEMDDLAVPLTVTLESSSQIMQREIVRRSVAQLLQEIVKWYGLTASGRALAGKCCSLLKKMGVETLC